MRAAMYNFFFSLYFDDKILIAICSLLSDSFEFMTAAGY